MVYFGSLVKPDDREENILDLIEDVNVRAGKQAEVDLKEISIIIVKIRFGF